MSKIPIILKREFAVRVRKKSFLLLTLLMPLLIAAVILVPALLSNISSGEEKLIAVVDSTGRYTPLFENNDRMVFVPEHEMKDSFKMADGPYDAVLVIDGDLTQPGTSAVIFSRNEVPRDVIGHINSRLTEQMHIDRLASWHIANADSILLDMKQRVSVQTVRWTDSGTRQSSSEIAAIIGMVLSMFIYIFILTYGGMVMQSVIEEKTGRIVEIMVSSVKPYELMFGKIIAIALTGLLQFAIWIIIALILVGSASLLFHPDVQGATAMQSLSETTPAMVANNPRELLQVLSGMHIGRMLLCYLLYFIGGYLLFAAIFAAIGASVNETQDSQQFMTPVIILFVFALYAGIFSINDPNAPFATWCSLIPFTSPIVMMVRLPFDVPLWQIILSLALLYLTAGLIVALSAKIYRTGILMYGKKPTFREMLRWLHYK